MAIAALRLAGCEGAWEKTDPGVRTIQQWIEDAWRAGFDPHGKQQLKGKLVGTSKWIGTSGKLFRCLIQLTPDLYAMFSYLGIDTRLGELSDGYSGDTTDGSRLPQAGRP